LLVRIKNVIEGQPSCRSSCRLHLRASLLASFLDILRTGLDGLFVEVAPETLWQGSIEDGQDHCKNAHRSEDLEEFVPMTGAYLHLRMTCTAHDFP
jgi:hypothetical protein